MQRRRDQRGAGRRLDDAAAIHDHHALAQPHDHCQVVADEESGEPATAPDVGQQVDDLALHRDIERAHRLVADDETRIRHQGARDHGALQLAARELVRIARAEFRREPHLGKQARDRPCALPRVEIRHQGAQRLRDALRNRHARVQAGLRVLEDVLQFTAQRPERPLAQGVHPPAVPADLAARKRHQAQDRAAERALAAAGFPDQPEHLAGIQPQAGAVHCRHGAARGPVQPVAHGHFTQFEQRSHGCGTAVIGK